MFQPLSRRVQAVQAYSTLGAALGFIILSLALTGCSPHGQSSTIETGETPPHPLAVAGSTSVSDSLAIVAMDLPDDIPVFDLPLTPDGLPALEDLESLYSQTLQLVAEQSLGLAQDHLFLLQENVALLSDSPADSLYNGHLRGLSRRTLLLGGLLAEQRAFAGHPLEADSLLAVEYGRLENFAFPDSLVPATGLTLPAFTADLLKVDNRAVQKWETYFTGRGRRSFQTWLDRKAEVDSLVTAILMEENLPPELIFLAVIESGLSTRAVSSAGAVGPWQFMSGTGKSYGLNQTWWVDERRDLEMSTRAAAKHLKRLYDQFEDWALVLAAYNSGEGRVARKIRQHGHDNFWSMRLPSQTTAYVPKYIAAARLGQNPEAYGFQVTPRSPLAYDVVPVNDATDLELIASCAGVPARQVLALNPALLRGASPPKMKNYPVKVPVGTGAKTLAALKRIPKDKRLTWRRHKVQRGESLGVIARSYGTSVNDLAKLNRLSDVHLIRPGDQLLIPMPAELADSARARAQEKGHYVPPAGYVRVSYKVKSGDSLGKVAQKLGVSLTHLRKVNNLHKTNLIHPGDRLYAYRPQG